MKKVMHKFVSVVLTNYHTKSWLEKIIHKSDKYYKICAEKLSSNSYVEKISSHSHLNSYTYICY